MAINIIPPNRSESLVEKDGSPTLRVANFFEALTRYLGNLPAALGALTASAVGALTASTVTQADATTAGATYNQAQVQSIVDLANANKVELNKAIVDSETIRTELNKAITDLETLRTAINGILE